MRRDVIRPRALLRALWAYHQTVDFVSGDRLSTNRPTDRRVGMLFLRTTGRKSGQPRRIGLNFFRAWLRRAGAGYLLRFRGQTAIEIPLPALCARARG
jgi:hypothetical protein